MSSLESLDRARRRRDASALGLTHEALAQEYATRHAGRLYYVHEIGSYFEYDDVRFVPEKTLHSLDLARAICREASAKAKELSKPTLATDLARASTVTAVERLARVDRGISVRADRFDQHPDLLVTPGGTIELTSGKLRNNRPSDFITKSTAVAPGGDCPLWEEFLADVCPNVELRNFLQRIAGYCLTGWTREHAIFFLFGTGANGKSVFLNTLMGILGDYAQTSPMETFTDNANDRHPTELARLRGARIVSAIETEEGRRWAESRIKALTGGDKIAAHFMRQDFFEFTPEFKLLIAGNHKPALRSVDEGIRRRMHLIPFTVTIAPADRDDELGEKLKREWPGILQWMLDGCRMWMADGLAPPEIVWRATDEYLGEEDAFGQWLAECCVVKDGYFATTGELYKAWVRWAEKAGEYVGSQKRLSRTLQDRGFAARREGGTGKRGFEGLGLIAPELPQSQDGGGL